MTKHTSVPLRAPLTLGEMLRILWDRRRLLLVASLSTGLVVAVISLVMKPVYRATVTMVPPSKGTDQGGLAALAGQFAGLADLAGVSLGSGADVDQSIALMNSRQFTEQFMQEEHVLPVMYPEMWDARAGQWRAGEASDGNGLSDLFSRVPGRSTSQISSGTGAHSEPGPSRWRAFKKFDALRRVSKDKKTNVVELSIDWTDPRLAAQWANDMVARLNQNARQRAISEADQNLEYLESELQKTHVIDMQQTVYKLIEREMRARMVANVRQEYAFRVLDPAQPPEERESPKRTLMVLAALFLGGFVASLWAIFGPPVTGRRADAST